MAQMNKENKEREELAAALGVSAEKVFNVTVCGSLPPSHAAAHQNRRAPLLATHVDCAVLRSKRTSRASRRTAR